MRKHIVGNADKCVFLAEHLSVLADEGQTVYVGVNHDTEVVLSAAHLVHDAREVLLERLRIMCEVACWLSVEHFVFHAETVEQLRQNDSSNRVDGIHAHLEASLLHCFGIYQLKAEHVFDVPQVGLVAVDKVSQFVNRRVAEVLALGNVEHLSTVFSREELAIAVEQLQRIPLTGVVAGCDDDATVGSKRGYGKFSGGRCGQSDVHHIVAHAHESAADNVVYHHSRKARVAPYDDGRAELVELCLATVASVLAYEGGVSRRELHYV